MTKVLTKQTIGVGVAGTGFIGPAHVEGLRRNGIQVLGLAEETEEKARQKATELGIPRVFASLDAMLADPEIEVVHIATPNHLHFPHAKAALMAGKHVICEKPLAMNTEQSGELVRLAAEKKLVNAVNFNLRMYPVSHQARSMVQGGELVAADAHELFAQATRLSNAMLERAQARTGIHFLEHKKAAAARDS